MALRTLSGSKPHLFQKICSHRHQLCLKDYSKFKSKHGLTELSICSKHFTGGETYQVNRDSVRRLVVGAPDSGDASVGGHDDNRGHVVFLKQPKTQDVILSGQNKVYLKQI